MKVYIIGCIIHKTWSNRIHLMVREIMNASVQAIFVFLLFYFYVFVPSIWVMGPDKLYIIGFDIVANVINGIEMKRVEELYYSSYIVLCILTLFFIFIFLRCVVNGFHDLKTLIYFIMRVNFYIFFLLQWFFFIYDRLFRLELLFKRS